MVDRRRVSVLSWAFSVTREEPHPLRIRWPAALAARWTRPVAVVAVTLGVVAAAAARAQAPLLTRTLDSSTVVRAHLTRGGNVQGALVTSFGPTSSTLVYCWLKDPRCTRSQPFRVPAGSIGRLEVQDGNKAGQGFWIGTVVAGVVLVPMTFALDGLGDGPSDTPGLFVSAVLTSALIGGGLGAVIGRSSPTWGPAP